MSLSLGLVLVQGVLRFYECGKPRRVEPDIIHLLQKDFHNRVSKVHEFLAYSRDFPTRPFLRNQLCRQTRLQLVTLRRKFREHKKRYDELSEILEDRPTPYALFVICIAFNSTKPPSYLNKAYHRAAVEHIALADLRRMIRRQERSWNLPCWQEDHVNVVLDRAFKTWSEPARSLRTEDPAPEQHHPYLPTMTV